MEDDERRVPEAADVDVSRAELPEAEEVTRVLLGRVYWLRRDAETSVRVVTPTRLVVAERVPTTRRVDVAVDVDVLRFCPEAVPPRRVAEELRRDVDVPPNVGPNERRLV